MEKTTENETETWVIEGFKELNLTYHHGSIYKKRFSPI